MRHSAKWKRPLSKISEMSKRQVEFVVLMLKVGVFIQSKKLKGFQEALKTSLIIN
jgi:low affinity Fe/Cu permease